ncbi:MAG TPA: AarF/ABC1/UbiB kinase family protein [Candidatus Tectomicrobia bacterium]|nr:AarF/ABC1/UbiB kinase family protein [Candidatus Tectomicrobia bacterium]
MLSWFDTLRDLPRLREIGRILFRHGLGHVAQRLRLPGVCWWRRLRRSPESVSLSLAERSRMIFEELGPTFIKFGQILSIRRDLLPDEYLQEFEKLQDAVPPFSYTEAARLIREEFGQDVKEVFAEFDPEPLASASIAQVHLARIKTGQAVIVKVQRPQIRQIILQDLAIMEHLAQLLVRRIPEIRRFDPVGLVEEFRKTILQELDFRREGRNADRLRQHLRETPGIAVPQVLWGYSTSRVLTSEYMVAQGLREALTWPPEERHRIAANLYRAFLRQIFENGFFHADPHPGNLLFLADGTVCLLDFGIVGRLSRERLAGMGSMLLAVMEQDVEALLDEGVALGFIAADLDRQAVQHELDDLLAEYMELPLRDISLGYILETLFALGRKHRLRVHANLALLGKTLLTVEAVIRALDPAFALVEEARGEVERLVRHRLAPDVLLQAGWRTTRQFYHLARRLPQRLERILQHVEAGRVRVELMPGTEAHVLEQWERGWHRAIRGAMVCALIIGSSLLIQAHIGPLIKGLSVMGLLGYGLALILGLPLLRTLRRRDGEW